MNKLQIAIVGYGNTGRGAFEAVSASPDMNVAGIVLRDKSAARQKGVHEGIISVENILELGKVDAAILCTPTRQMPAVAAQILSYGINTVDSYDFHADIYDRKVELDKTAKANNSVAILASGWDPGSDSIIRALFEAAAPRGVTTTDFGPGMSMGHTTAVGAIPGVKKALSVTVPKGSGLHRRMVYVELNDPGQFEEISGKIKNDPYFVNDETHVKLVDSVDALTDKGHGVKLTRKGAAGITDNQNLSFTMSVNNPAFTGQLLAASARASVKLASGCYTMIEIPPIDLLPGDRETLIRKLV